MANKYKFANPEHTFVNDLEEGIYGIHPGVHLWKNVQDWLDDGNTIEDYQTEPEKLAIYLKGVEDKLKREKTTSKDSGILVDGVKFDTDIEARIAYIEFMIKLMQNPSYTVTNWKASEGVWVTMDATLFGKLTTAWEGHLTSLFSFIKAKEIEIKSKTTKEQLDSIVVDFS